MDTRIWMQESFWESAEEQNGKESPQENAEHLSKDQNENGGNKPVDQKTSLWQQTYENILVGMGMCVITLNFLLLNYILPSIGILMIFLGLRRLRRENRWFRSAWACWDQTASYDISSDRWNIYRQGKNRSSRSLEDRFYSRWNLAAANFYLFLLRFNHRIKETW